MPEPTSGSGTKLACDAGACELPAVGAVGGRPADSLRGWSAFHYCSEMHRRALIDSLTASGWAVKTEAVQ